ncbi:hypothetical protein [Amycolatopsis sp. CA-128772]|uniref:hypothetical protein n=1 Tax=Amycolatopsis sp. CA-128772 TaxID=2073159 RepID=UPI0011B01359|nr:hypothetical protein [Amycolatopsis sp. CA-128772]
MPEESTDQEPPERAGTTINQISDNSGNAVQARDVHGDVRIGAHPDNDVEIVLQPEQSEIVLAVGHGCKVVPLTVNCHLSQPLILELSLRGASTPRWTVEPAEITVRPGVPEVATLRLPCSATEPQAGPKHLRVVAKQQGGKREWQSQPPVTVTVPAKPGLVVKPKIEPTVLHGGTQTIIVAVCNTGNTRLAGSLMRWKPSAGVAGYLPPEAVAPPNGGTPPFELAPGATAERPVVVTLPPPEMTERTWCLPIAVRLDGVERPMPVPDLTVTQAGWLTQIPGYARRLASWGRAEHGPYRRVTLAISGIALFVAGLLLGSNIFASRATGESSAATTSASSQDPAVSSIPSLFAPVPYERMTCTAGTSVVYLASMTRREADEYAAYFVQREYSRMNNLNPPLSRRYAIHVTARPDLCPTLRRLLDQSPSMREYSTFIWIDAPTSEAAGICKDLDQRQAFDCHPVPVS